MVEERLTDGYRVAELLASEIDGRTSGPLGDLAVTDPDRTVEGSAAGERAFDVRRLDGERDPRREPRPAERGPLLARAFVHEEGITLAIHAERSRVAVAAESAGLSIDECEATDPAAVGVAIPSGAAVKRAVDVLASVADAAE